jgi:hypothetical protein
MTATCILSHVIALQDTKFVRACSGDTTHAANLVAASRNISARIGALCKTMETPKALADKEMMRYPGTVGANNQHAGFTSLAVGLSS